MEEDELDSLDEYMMQINKTTKPEVIFTNKFCKVLFE